MALTIAVVSLKGGVGKSTIAQNIASAVYAAGKRALVIDTDPQATSQNWAAKGAELDVDGPPVVGVKGRSLKRDLVQLANGFELVVVDTPPRLDVEAKSAMLASHLVLMPITPGGADVWALRETLAVLEKSLVVRPDLKAAVVLNRVNRTTLAKLTRKSLEDAKVGTLNTALGDRVAFGEAMLAGEGVVTYAPRSKASTEVEKLVREVMEMV